MFEGPQSGDGIGKWIGIRGWLWSRDEAGTDVGLGFGLGFGFGFGFGFGLGFGAVVLDFVHGSRHCGP